jgi:CRP-like cAMP-binding protein
MMQLDALILYNEQGDQRAIKFEVGRLNIITGDSQTGKSSLINILRFCLGGDSPQAPFGPIRQTVSWYGLLAHVSETSFFIGRPAPRTAATTAAAMLIVGAPDIPEYGTLEPNTTAEALRRYLAGLLGVQDNLHVPSANQSRRALSAGFAHALYYCFQGQGEIANPEILFHHQNREFIPQAIRDTLPYFLGAQSVDELQKRHDLLGMRRQLRLLERELAVAEAEREAGVDRTAALVSEAREVGLLDREVPAALDEIRELLTRIATSPSVLERGEAAGEFERLVARKSQLLADLREANESLRLLEDYALIGQDFAGELNEQRARLASLNLIPTSTVESPQCAMCRQPLGDDSG